MSMEDYNFAKAREAWNNTRPWYTIDELNAWADEKEKQAWRNAAIRIGEELSSVGPDGYYDMDAWQWLDWAMEQEPRGKNSSAQPKQDGQCKRCTDGCPACDARKLPEQEPVACKECHLKDTVYDLLGDLKVANLKLSIREKRTLIGLTDEEREQVINANTSTGLWHMAKDIEAKLKEKNT